MPVSAAKPEDHLLLLGAEFGFLRADKRKACDISIHLTDSKSPHTYTHRAVLYQIQFRVAY